MKPSNKNKLFRAMLLAVTLLGICSVAPAVAVPTEITVYLIDCDCEPIIDQDITIQPAYGGSWGPVYSATTDGSGIATADVTPGYTKIRVTLNQGSEQQLKTVDDEYIFVATKLTILLEDHTGAPITDEGGSVDQGGGYWYHHGNTDSSGELSVYVFRYHNYKFRVTYNYTSMTRTFYVCEECQQTEVFQTQLAVVTLSKNCSDDPLDGGVVTYAAGSWRAFGTTGDDGPGLVNKELFPGNYKIRLTYNYITNQIVHDLTTNFDFKTVEVTLFGVSSAQYAGGSWRTFTLPTMDLLPGTYKFRLDGVTQYITVDEDNCTQTLGYLTLLDENGDGLAGGVATPACGGSWEDDLPGQTDSNGKLLAILPDCFTKIRMTVNQTSQEQLKAELESDDYTWQTETATIHVLHSDGSDFAGVQIDQGGGFWDDNKAVTDDYGMAYIPVFAGSAKFRADWNHTSQQITQAVPSTFTFQTGVIHSDSGTCTQWAGGSWYTFTQDMEVFPGNYHFKFSDGTSITYYDIYAATVNHIH